MATLYAQQAWLGHVATDVAIEVSDGSIASVKEGVRAPSDARRLTGLVLPGFVNAHSHAFHRALRGRTHALGGDFWTWRDAMYQVADRLDPEIYRRLARATYAEMALAGITHVFEFHYLHHDRGGRRYSDPNAMGAALAEAAADVGIRLTLLDSCYLRAGLGNAELSPVQQRFSDGSVDDWSERVRARQTSEASLGVAIHSVRAVDRDAIGAVASVARDLDVPLHVHVSEQRRENDECLATYDLTPTEVLADAGALGPRTAAVHATHVTQVDIELLAATGTSVCICPTTERDLGDGIGPTSQFVGAGIALLLGSDSHAIIDLFEEARAAELDERLAQQRRGLTAAATLLTAATAGRRIEAGQPADLIAIDLDSPRLAGATDDVLLESVVFAGTAADVYDVMVGGEYIVRGGEHEKVPYVADELEDAIGTLMS